MMAIKGPVYPIIYVRGYAMTTGEQDDTTADPFCGFNLGSTVYRAAAERDEKPRKFIFESPLVRLASDYGYQDVYDRGYDITDREWTGNDPENPGTLPRKSLVIYRYYDEASALLGKGKTPPIEEFAKGLSTLILRVRDLVCARAKNNISPSEFKCHLVAHSMGGLVARAFLQNPKLGDKKARACVDKFFTYATPHNGIDVVGTNVPAWLGLFDIDNFSKPRMAQYLNLKSLFRKTERVDWIPEDVLPSKRIFCMVGTNRADYEVALGLSRTFVGNGSDGLVRIENATLAGVDGEEKPTVPAARAYAFRSHSGFFGIVNSEEAYQNLTRFLFGTHRADIWLKIDDVRLPALIKDKEKVTAGYQFEFTASPKGKRWYLSRRIAEEDSVACRSHEELTEGGDDKRNIYLSTVFLDEAQCVDQNAPQLTFHVRIGVRTPDYEVDRKFWPNEHFEGGYLCNHFLAVVVTPPGKDRPGWSFDVQRGTEAAMADRKTEPVTPTFLPDERMLIEIPVGDKESMPGLTGMLQIFASPWNEPEAD